MKKIVQTNIIAGLAFFLSAGISFGAKMDDLDVTIRVVGSDDMTEMHNELSLPDMIPEGEHESEAGRDNEPEDNDEARDEREDEIEDHDEAREDQSDVDDEHKEVREEEDHEEDHEDVLYPLNSKDGV